MVESTFNYSSPVCRVVINLIFPVRIFDLVLNHHKLNGAGNEHQIQETICFNPLHITTRVFLFLVPC